MLDSYSEQIENLFELKFDIPAEHVEQRCYQLSQRYINLQFQIIPLSRVCEATLCCDLPGVSYRRPAGTEISVCGTQTEGLVFRYHHCL